MVDIYYSYKNGDDWGMVIHDGFPHVSENQGLGMALEKN